MILVTGYLIMIVLANLSVTHFGTDFVIINSVVLIGFDMFARDGLHELWHGNKLKIKMALLIFTGSALSFFLSRDSLRIGVASFLAFSSSGFIDFLIYSWLWKRSKMVKMNGSNLVSALVDTIVFMSLAFTGSFMYSVAIKNFIGKFAGGAVWSYFLTRWVNDTKSN
jgi:uncharacterized PurR-regulated membrane protein YhhQ (DUF165 family)